MPTNPTPAGGTRTCLRCGETNDGWQYDRCPNCGELDEPLAQAEPGTTELHQQLAETTKRAEDAERELAEFRLTLPTLGLYRGRCGHYWDNTGHGIVCPICEQLAEAAHELAKCIGPGTLQAILEGWLTWAEREFGHSPYSSRPALLTAQECVAKLREQLTAETALLEASQKATADLRARLDVEMDRTDIAQFQTGELEKYVNHKSNCAFLLATNELVVPCDCGLKQLLETTPAANQQASAELRARLDAADTLVRSYGYDHPTFEKALKQALKDGSEEAIEKRRVTDKFADYCIERNELLASNARMREALEGMFYKHINGRWYSCSSESSAVDACAVLNAELAKLEAAAEPGKVENA